MFGLEDGAIWLRVGTGGGVVSLQLRRDCVGRLGQIRVAGQRLHVGELGDVLGQRGSCDGVGEVAGGASEVTASSGCPAQTRERRCVCRQRPERRLEEGRRAFYIAIEEQQLREVQPREFGVRNVRAASDHRRLHCSCPAARVRLRYVGADRTDGAVAAEEERVRIGDLGLEVEAVRDVLDAIAGVVDLDSVRHFGVEGVEVGATRRLLEAVVVGDEGDRIGCVRTDERIQVR